MGSAPRARTTEVTAHLAPPVPASDSVRSLRRVNGRLELVSGTFPAPAPGEALVRPLMLSIASPDLAVASGRVDFKGVVGHECVGVIESVGAVLPSSAKQAEGARDPASLIGTRVVVNPFTSCGQCDLCTRGLSNHCQSRKVRGLHGAEGCFADVLTAPLTSLIPLPRKVGDAAAACASTVAGALHACAMVRVEHKPFVTVLGDGPVGLLVAQVLSRRNASVRLLGLSPARFQICEKWGVKHRHVAECGQRMDQDVVIDCTGSSRGTQTALSMLRPLGKLIVKGWPLPSGTGSEARVALAPALAGELTITGAGPGNIAEALAAMERGEVDVESLLARRFRLADWEKAYAAAKDTTVVKVILTP